MVFLVYASELAAFIGMHKYKTQEEIFLQVWDRVDNGNHKDLALERLRKKKLTPKEKITKHTTIDLKDLTQTVKECSSVKDLRDEVKKTSEKIPKDNVLLHKELLKLVETEMVTTFGSTKEGPSIKKYEKKHQKTIGSSNDKFYSMPLFQLGRFKWGIGGRIDGLENGVLVEVKNRRNRLFKKSLFCSIINSRIGKRSLLFCENICRNIRYERV